MALLDQCSRNAVCASSMAHQRGEMLQEQNGQLVSSNGQVDGLKVTGFVILAVANAAGIPIIDAVKNLYPPSSKAG